MVDIIQIVDKSPTPSLLPIFRSQQQAEVLHLLLADPDLELGLTEISERLGVPYASIHREVERAEAAGLVASRRIGRTRLIKANESSPYFASLADLLVKAFGPPMVLAEALRMVKGIERAVIFGSWAASYAGAVPGRPVGDIDLLILGDPDRDDVFARLRDVEQRLGREVQVTIRAIGWFEGGSGPFHENVASRPIVELDLSPGDISRLNDS